MPSSLTLEEEEWARHRFYQNQIRVNKSSAQQEVIKIVNLDSSGRLDPSIYTRYKSLLAQEKKARKSGSLQHAHRKNAPAESTAKQDASGVRPVPKPLQSVHERVVPI